MTVLTPSHPLDRLSRADRRRWRRLDRRARGTLDAEQLRRLRDLAGSRAAVAFVSRSDTCSPWVTVIEVGVGSWRLVGRVAARTAGALEAAVGAGPVWLAAASRYGPYWTLTFGGRAAPVPMLVNGLVLSRRHGGVGSEGVGPVLELVG